jgi:hypothetical protein
VAGLYNDPVFLFHVKSPASWLQRCKVCFPLALVLVFFFLFFLIFNFNFFNLSWYWSWFQSKLKDDKFRKWIMDSSCRSGPLETADIMRHIFAISYSSALHLSALEMDLGSGWSWNLCLVRGMVLTRKLHKLSWNLNCVAGKLNCHFIFFCIRIPPTCVKINE